jgi:sigma-B regulation protein RsbU (phosphoserine phosphatase)
MNAGKLLVVDDEPSVRQSLATYLEDSGFEVLEAQDGREGLEQIRSHNPELVLCDLRMPGMDGLELLGKIASEQPDLPVIVVSGAGSMSDVVDALRLGASDYLVKPIVDLQVLEYSVKRSLERARLRRENQLYKEELEAVNRQLTEHLRELQKDQRAGRHIQMGMLPPSPMAIEQYRLSHRIIPSLFLSGDFVDYFRITEKHFVFYIADVSGHGASSAFVTVLLKNFSRRLRREYKVRMLNRPGEILSRLNQELLDNALEKHVTMFIGVVNIQANRLAYSNAGHFPYPIAVRDGTASYLEMPGKPLGLFADAEYESVRVELSDVSQLVMFSDGVLEVMEDDSLAAKEAHLLKSAASGRPDLDTLWKRLDLTREIELPDDIACLIVEKLDDHD